jgi:hypothetical protein
MEVIYTEERARLMHQITIPLYPLESLTNQYIHTHLDRENMGSIEMPVSLRGVKISESMPHEYKKWYSQESFIHLQEDKKVYIPRYIDQE